MKCVRHHILKVPSVERPPLLALFLVLLLLLLLHIPIWQLLPPSPVRAVPPAQLLLPPLPLRAVHSPPPPIPGPGSICTPLPPEGGANLAIVIAGRANAAHRHTAIYLTLALTLRTVARHYPWAAVYLVDNGGGKDGSLAELLNHRALALPPGTRLPKLLNNTKGGYEMGAYAHATEVLGWSRCFPFTHALFIQHTMALATPLPPLSTLPCFHPVFHFEDAYDSIEQVAWVREALQELHLLGKDEDPPLCRGTAGTSFLLSSSCINAWLARGVFSAVAQRMGDSTVAYMATERLVPHLAQGLCGGCSGEGGGGGGGGGCSVDSFMGTGICDGDGVEAVLRSETLYPERYKGRTFVKTVGSGMCGSVNLREDLRRGGGEGDVWALLDAPN